MASRIEKHESLESLRNAGVPKDIEDLLDGARNKQKLVANGRSR